MADQIPIRIDVSPSFHPDVIAGHEDDVHPHVYADAREALALVYESIGRLKDTHAALRQADAPTARRMHGGRFRDVVQLEEFYSAAAKHYDRTLAAVSGREKRLRAAEENSARALESALDDSWRKTVDGAALASEIRTHIKASKEAERAKFVMLAADAGDKRTVVAVLQAPSYLSGLDTKGMALVREHAARTLAPAEHKALGAIRTMLARFEGAMRQMQTDFAAVASQRSRAGKSAVAALQKLKEG